MLPEIRDFCPMCMIITTFKNGPFHCDKCNSTDLIPNPNSTIPTSKLQLDEVAVNKLLNDDFGYLSGSAGTGKSTLILELNRMYPDLFEICATTGIAAVNLNAKTIHSTLKFFNYTSLEAAWREGLLHFNLRLVRARKKKLFLDEMSMMGADMFDLIMNAVDEINSDDTGKQLGVWISGDLCQLPAIKDKQFTHEKNGDYIFKSDYWDRFANNTVRLTKVWRQDNIEFMKGINLLRAGQGKAAMDIFKSCGVNFANKVDDNFPGTTLISKNVDVDSYNDKRLQQINSPLIRVCSINKGAQHKEWQRLIPFELRLKVGALVMILCNDVPAFSYVNGDLGIIEKYDPLTEAFHIKLQRTGQTAVIGRIMRPNLQDNEPEYPTGNFIPYSDFKTGQWIIGTIEYFPLRLAYASTIHKCLHEDTIVKERDRGFIPIKYIIKNDAIWNGNKFVYVKAVSNSMQQGIEIETMHYKTRASLDHKYPVLWDSSDLILVKDLKIGQQLLDGNRCISGDYTYVTGLKMLLNKLPMVDLEIEDTKDSMSHLFWADGLITHNSQGLSLDTVQIDSRAQFFGFPSMAYVSISRARTPQGLYLVGSPESIAAKVKVSKEVIKYV